MKTWDEALIKLKELKGKSKLSYSQIATLSDVPLSTVTRIFSNQTSNPSITTVLDIVKALGGDVSDIFSGSFRDEIKNETPEQKEMIEEVIKKVERTGKTIMHTDDEEFTPCRFHKETVEMYKISVKKYEKWAKALFIVNLFIVVALLVILLVDILNSDIGYIR
ncbi:MAG: helix-turn-helix transcriptional regulator [Ruminococcus sp.]|nr:helix-turn-helix transcriptional regulator [Candidatus Copronaster equi]